MPVITARITVAPDGAITGQAPHGVPPGEHPVAITVPTPPAGKLFSVKDFPMHDEPWDDSISLRREDMYDDEGRLR